MIRKMNRTLTLASLLVVSLLVLTPSVHASSQDKILTMYIETRFWGLGPDNVIRVYGKAWGDLWIAGTIFARPYTYKVVGSTWHVHCTEYWWDYYPVANPLVAEPKMISGVDGTMEWVTPTTAEMIYNGQVKSATGPYVELVGRNVHFEGTLTILELVPLDFKIEATLWFMPNK